MTDTPGAPNENPDGDDLTLPQTFIDEMIAHAQSQNPSECCGVIARFPDGALKLYRATNAYRTLDAMLPPGDNMAIHFHGRVINGEAGRYRFSIPQAELLYLYTTIEGQEGDVLVVYHSHTMSEARPSPTDLGIAATLNRGADPWPYWVLVSLAESTPSVRAWRIDETDTAESVTAVEIPLRGGTEPPGSSRVRLRTGIVEVPLSGEPRGDH